VISQYSSATVSSNSFFLLRKICTYDLERSQYFYVPYMVCWTESRIASDAYCFSSLYWMAQ
jgi:hypothetical protein